MSAAILIVDDHPVVPMAVGALIEQRFAGVRSLQAANLRQARAVYQVEPTLVATVLDPVSYTPVTPATNTEGDIPCSSSLLKAKEQSERRLEG